MGNGQDDQCIGFGGGALSVVDLAVTNMSRFFGVADTFSHLALLGLDVIQWSCGLPVQEVVHKRINLAFWDSFADASCFQAITPL